MVFKLFSTLDFLASKPVCANAYGFLELFSTLDFELQKPCASTRMVFKLFSALDYQA